MCVDGRGIVHLDAVMAVLTISVAIWRISHAHFFFFLNSHTTVDVVLPASTTHTLPATKRKVYTGHIFPPNKKLAQQILCMKLMRETRTAELLFIDRICFSLIYYRRFWKFQIGLWPQTWSVTHPASQATSAFAWLTHICFVLGSDQKRGSKLYCSSVRMLMSYLHDDEEGKNV